MPSLFERLRRHTTDALTSRRGLTIADIRMEAVAQWSGRAALLVGGFAFAISFMQIKWVAEELGTDPRWLAWFFPMLIDLPSLVASALTVALHNRRFRVRLYAWLVLIFFSLASWACNGVHALSTLAEGNNRFVVLIAELTGVDQHSGWLIALVLAFAAIPPIGIVLGVHLWAYALRHSAAADQRADGKAAKTTQKQQSGSTVKTDPGTERSGQKQQTDPGTKPAGTEQKAAPTEQKTAPTVEENAPAGRHAAPAEETAPETAPAAETAPTRSGPKRSAGHPPRTLIDFQWKRSDAEITARPGNEWKLTARNRVREIWENDPDAVNAAEIGRELGNPVAESSMRKLVNPAFDELEAWPHFTTADAGADRAALLAELHAADPVDDDTDTAPVEDRQAVDVA